MCSISRIILDEIILFVRVLNDAAETTLGCIELEGIKMIDFVRSSGMNCTSTNSWFNYLIIVPCIFIFISNRKTIFDTDLI
jgi:hypothetical protein